MAGGQISIEVALGAEPCRLAARPRARGGAAELVARAPESADQKRRADASGKAVRDPATKVSGGEPSRWPSPSPSRRITSRRTSRWSIVFEDEHLLVVDKPAGLVVHPAAGNRDGTLVNALLHHCGDSLSGIGGVARPGIVHRIDKDTSGLLVVAKTDVAHEGLARQFAEHSIDRRYLAIVSGVPLTASGTVDAPLARSSANRKKIAASAKGAASAPSPIGSRIKLLAATRRWSNAGWRPAGPTRSASTWPRSAILCSATPSMDGGKGASQRVVQSIGLSPPGAARRAPRVRPPRNERRLSFDSALPSDMQELFSALGV